ncbi:MAG: glycerol-3-phosphate dehydrogenase, partial [Burkholderiales bacterium PBB5]
MRAARENQRYLPGVPLPATLEVVAGQPGARQAVDTDLVVVATPMAGLRQALVALEGCTAPVAWLCKGFEAAHGNAPGLLGHEIRIQVAPALRAGTLTGPSFAQEVAAGRPTALVAASEHADVRDALVAAFHGPNLRVYANDDLPGAEVGGA